MRRGQVAREARRTAATERQAVRDGRTDEQQLHKLVGEGHGHCKEAQRLAGVIPEFCLACGASIPHREGEGRCELCLHHEVSDE